MSYRHQLTRNHGHPSTREAGWDMLEADADSPRELDAYIAAAQRKFWKVWERPTPRTVRLYKPTRAGAEWTDAPGSTELGKMLAGIDMSASTLHIDLTLASMAHHVRSAPTLADLLARLHVALEAYGGSGKAVSDAHAGLANAVPALNGFIHLVEGMNESEVSWREACQAYLSAAEATISFPAPPATLPTPARRRPGRHP